MAKPDIVIVPGLWEGPRLFNTVADKLRQKGFTVTIAALLSTGKTNPPNTPEDQRYTMDSDIAAIRRVVEPLVVEQGKDVVMVLHSAGGFLGSNAIEGLSKKARSAKGLAGGVTRIVFMAAGVANEGYVHTDRPFFDIVGDEMWCKSPRDMLYNDILDDAEAAKYVQKLSCQPASGYSGTTTYAGWKEVPSVFLVCEKDMCIPKDIQLYFAKLAGSEVVLCDAAHMVQLTQPDKVVDVISKAASVGANL